MAHLPRRKTPRVDWYDYSSPGTYFVTFCTNDRICYFGDIVCSGRDTGLPCPEKKMLLSPIGKICDEQLHIMVEKRPTIILHEYIIMPNHVHVLFDVGTDTGLLHPNDRTPQADVPTANIHNQSQGSIIGGWKSAVSRMCIKHNIPFARQSRYHDHIVRDQTGYLQIKHYIKQNVRNWSEDSFF